MSTTFIAVVGKQKKEFTLYQSVATRSSKFFSAAMSGEWKGNQQKRVSLEEVDVSEFESYLQWLSTNDHTFLKELNMDDLTCLYILGDFLNDSAFRTVILNLLVQRAVNKNAYPGATIVAFVWEHTPETSPLRKIIVEMWTTSSIETLGERFAESDEDAPKAFIVDCVQRLAKRQDPRVDFFGEQRKLVLEACRDEIIKEQIG